MGRRGTGLPGWRIAQKAEPATGLAGVDHCSAGLRRSVFISDVWAVFDTEGLWRIILLSLGVSLSATALAVLFGAPLGAALAACPIPGRRILVVAANAFLGLPPGGCRSGALPAALPVG